MPTQLIDFGAKRLDVLKAAVHGGEAHVPDFVQMPQFFHDHIADAARGDLALAQTAQPVTYSGNGGFDRVTTDGALLQRPLHSSEQLVLIERLATAVVLDDGGKQQLRGFESREALRAFETFAAPANLTPFAGEARVDDFSLRVTAKWAMHGDYLARSRCGPCGTQA